MTWVIRVLAIVLTALPVHGFDDNQHTVMTFNIRYGTADDGEDSWLNRDHLVMQVLETHDASIVGLQEALTFQLNEITDAHPHYGIIGVGRDDGNAKGEHAAILYDTRKFVVDRSETFWLSDTPEVIASTSWGNDITRICTWARLISRDSGLAIYVFNTHLDHQSQESREKSIELITNRIDSRQYDDPFVLTGDFNAGELNPVVITLKDNPDYRHAFRTVHPDATNVGTYKKFGGVRNMHMIDHIFVNSTTKVLDAGIDTTEENGRLPSDHYAVWATIELP